MRTLADKFRISAFIIWAIGLAITFLNCEIIILLDYPWMYVVCPALLITTLAMWAIAFGLLVVAEILDGKEK